MKRIFGASALALSLVAGSFAGVAIADESEADSCLRQKIWDGYNDGWAVRTATSATLKQGEYRIYLVTLYAGNEYKVLSCADGQAKNVDLVLHDSDGNVVVQDEGEGREPTLSYKPTTTDTYYVAVHATSPTETTAKSGVGMAVTYK